MRCGAIITHKERRSRAGTRMVINQNATVTWWGTSDVGVFPTGPTFAEALDKPDTEVCDGQIIATVEAEEEPYMGGSSAVFSVSYRCDKCSNQFFLELPQDEESVSAMLTSYIATLDEVPLRAARREQELATRAQQEAWRLEALASLKARQQAGREAKSRKAVSNLAPQKPKG